MHEFIRKNPYDTKGFLGIIKKYDMSDTFRKA